MVKSSMSKIKSNYEDDGPVLSEGGRRPSPLSTGSPSQNGGKFGLGELRSG